MNDYNGIIIINKEQGYTSMDAVALVRGILRLKRAGHTGTLDPDASGVLPVCLGTATRLVEMMTDTEKEYRAVMLLGMSTDTQDISGQVTGTGDWSGISEAEIRSAVSAFTGTLEQLPPMYSAVKVRGKKLVDLARKGVEVERPVRRVEIKSIRIDRIGLPEVELTVRCSKGTYIRTLCHDIGQRLGCGACMKSLVRTEAAGFPLERTLTLRELEQARDEGRIGEVLVPIDEYFADLPACTVSPQDERYLLSGNRLKKEQIRSLKETGSVPESGMLRMYTLSGAFLALYEADPEKGDYRVRKMFV